MSTKILIFGFIGLVALLLIGDRVLNSNGQASVGGGVSQQRESPNFSLSALDGSTIVLADYQGDKPVILDFFATWCPNCRRDMPKLNRFYEEYKDEVEVIGVNLRENKSIVQEYIRKAGIDFPIVMDPSGQIAQAFRIQYTNTHILIDKNGTIVRVIPGDIRESDIVSLIQ
ncbi:redoxin domain-containing protein [Patescibacteria group bacterium]|nr:redoxin domain-containing protein [Patescibacteria group bacterium]